MLELGVAVRVAVPFFRLAVALQTIPCRLQQSPHGPWADRMSLPRQLARQLRRALARPSQRRLRISAGHRIDQPFQTGSQFGIDRREPFATAARFSQPRLTGYLGTGFSCLKFGAPYSDRGRRHARGAAHRPQTTPTVRPCFRRRPLTTHPFVHQRSQSSVPRFNPLNGGCILHGRLVPETTKVIKLC